MLPEMEKHAVLESQMPDEVILRRPLGLGLQRGGSHGGSQVNSLLPGFL